LNASLAGATSSPVPQSDVLSAALAWAALGRRVFPTIPGEKQPAVRWSEAATTSEEQVRIWFQKPKDIGMPGPRTPPDYGLGLPTGDGLIVIDIDTAKGGEIPDWAPHTHTVYTPSGGWHLYYEVDREVPNSVGRLAPGVDVRGDGGYVLAPPTPGYKVAISAPIAALDPLLLTAVQRRGGAFTRDRFEFPERDPETGEVKDPIGEGERNDWLLRACGHGRELGIDDEGTLTEWALNVNQLYIDPPLDEAEVRHVVRSSLRYLGS
jgi:hypothetical protein